MRVNLLNLNCRARGFNMKVIVIHNYETLSHDYEIVNQIQVLFITYTIIHNMTCSEMLRK